MSAETLIDLQQFCEKDGIRYYLAQPFILDGNTYASNGRIIVRIPGGGADTELPRSFAAAVRKMFAAEHTDFAPLPTISAPKVCPDCKGTGRLENVECADCGGIGEFRHGRHDYDCLECDGTGRYGSRECTSCWNGELLQPVPVGAAHFQARYLRMIAALPNARMSAPAKDGPAAFVFDGGEGRLMPCRPE